MSKKNNFMISCDEANHVCDKTQYKEATIWEKIRLNIHLIYCRACRKYTKNNTKLTVSIKTSEVKCMPKEDKIAIKESLTQAIREVQN